MLRIPAELQKNNNETLWPIAPEWGDMLLAVPAADRHGPVFRLLAVINPKNGQKHGGIVSDPDYICHVVCQIGKTAGVVVNRTTKLDRKTGERREVVKYASCHDLRRSFGFRWADRVDTFKLQELMRHSNIETTRRFYVGRNAQNTAASLWAARDRATGNGDRPSGRNTFDNNRPAEQPAADQETTQALAPQGLMEYSRQDSNL
jgi:integrase